MDAWSKRFGLVFFLGFLLFIAALGYGRLNGSMFSPNPLLVAMRFMGIDLMASGLALWITSLRAEAGKPGLNTLIGLMVVGGLILSFVHILLPSTSWTQFFGWSGAALTVMALMIGVLAMIVSPAYAKPLTTRWPEGGENMDSQHS